MEKSESQSVIKETIPWQPPVVTVMGHVDHGKTTLLDAIRHTQVAARESGGITQHIGAYSVDVGGRPVTFIDTPGHEAFSLMRSQASKVADVVILVIDASEGVKPQTLEAISHTKDQKATVIVALNKMDLPGANPNLVKGQLAENGILVEGCGGNTVVVELSAKTGQGITNLLEMVVLTAQLNRPGGDPDGSLEAYVIESGLDRRRGPLATLVVKNGRISIGDEISAGPAGGKVRQILDDRGNRLPRLFPGMASQVLGFSKTPNVGEKVVLGSGFMDLKAKAAAPVLPFAGGREKPTLNFILKADVTGSLEAVRSALSKLPLFGPEAAIIAAGVGDVGDSDVNLAKATSAVIIAFRVRVAESVANLAESLGVEIRSYQIIYKLTDEMELALKGVSEWQKDQIKGQATVLKIFTLGSGDVVYGCRIIHGRLSVKDELKVIRADSEVGRSRIKNLKIGKERVNKVTAEKECGVMLSGEVKVAVGDNLEVV